MNQTNNTNAVAHNATGANDPLQHGTIAASLVELAQRHDNWFETEHQTSQRALYCLLADCLRVYRRIKDGPKTQRAYLDTYLDENGIKVGANSSLLGKVVKGMCGSNSSKVNAYIGVLKVAVGQGQQASTLKDWLIEHGGIAKARQAFRKVKPSTHREDMVRKGIAQLSTKIALGSQNLPSDVKWDDTNDTDYVVGLMRRDGQKLKLMTVFTRRGLVEDLLRSVSVQADQDPDLTPTSATSGKTMEDFSKEIGALRDAA